MSNFRRKKIIETLQTQKCIHERNKVLQPYSEFLKFQINDKSKRLETEEPSICNLKETIKNYKESKYETYNDDTITQKSDEKDYVTTTMITHENTCCNAREIINVNTFDDDFIDGDKY